LEYEFRPPPACPRVSASFEAAIERAKKLGATLMNEKSPVPGMDWFAMLTDPQGNPLAIWQSDSKAK